MVTVLERVLKLLRSTSRRMRLEQYKPEDLKSFYATLQRIVVQMSDGRRVPLGQLGTPESANDQQY